MDKNVLTANDIKLLSQNPSVENKGSTARKVTAYYDGGLITERGLKLAEDIFRIMVEDIEVKVREILSDSLKKLQKHSPRCCVQADKRSGQRCRSVHQTLCQPDQGRPDQHS